VWKWILAHIWYALGSTPGTGCDTIPLVAYYNHAMPPHMHMDEYSSATREPERHRAGGVALIGHLTRILNITGRKDNKIMSGNLRFSPSKLMDGRQTWWEKIRDEVAGLFRDKLDVSVPDKLVSET
jgi:hypothetical protein